MTVKNDSFRHEAFADRWARNIWKAGVYDFMFLVASFVSEKLMKWKIFYSAIN